MLGNGLFRVRKTDLGNANEAYIEDMKQTVSIILFYSFP